MKYLDTVRLIKNEERYKEDNIKLGDLGTIWLPEIRNNEFYVSFDTGDDWNAYKYSSIKIEDLELVEDNGETDEEILEDLPEKNPEWWCKV